MLYGRHHDLVARYGIYVSLPGPFPIHYLSRGVYLD
jgi:hypothetical protein